MMKYLFVILMVFLFIITLTDNVIALRLNEIEANPEGDDSGFEWVELYSLDAVSIDGYILDHEGRGAPLNLSGSFQGFFIINLQTQWLRNLNETVYLKFNEEVIDSVGSFNDNKVEKTYGLCDGEWKFTSSTKNEENYCDSGNTQTTTNNSQNQQNSNSEDEQEETNESLDNKVIDVVNLTKKLSEDIPDKKSKISLNENNELKSEITKTYKTRINVIYFFIGFCVLLVVLIAFKKL